LTVYDAFEDDEDDEDDDDVQSDVDDEEDQVELARRTPFRYSETHHALCTVSGWTCLFADTAANGKMPSSIFRNQSSKMCIACQRRIRSYLREKSRSGLDLPTISWKIDDLTSDELLRDEQLPSKQVKSILAIIAALRSNDFHAVGQDNADNDEDDADYVLDGESATDDDDDGSDLKPLRAMCPKARTNSCQFAHSVTDGKMPVCLFRGLTFKQCISCQRRARSRYQIGQTISWKIVDLTEHELLQEKLPPKQVKQIMEIVALSLSSSPSAEVARAAPHLKASTHKEDKPLVKSTLGTGFCDVSVDDDPENEQDVKKDETNDEEENHWPDEKVSRSALAHFTQQQKQIILQRSRQGISLKSVRSVVICVLLNKSWRSHLRFTMSCLCR
jgi:hypothetical protein